MGSLCNPYMSYNVTSLKQVKVLRVEVYGLGGYYGGY